MRTKDGLVAAEAGFACMPKSAIRSSTPRISERRRIVSAREWFNSIVGISFRCGNLLLYTYTQLIRMRMFTYIQFGQSKYILASTGPPSGWLYTLFIFVLSHYFIVEEQDEGGGQAL